MTDSGPTSRPVERCQICDRINLESILFVGYMPPVNTMLTVGTVPTKQPAYPLALLRCWDYASVEMGL